MPPTLVSRASPQIAGSSKAFIAVVVVLSVVILAACAGIIYLVISGKRKQSTTPSSPTYQYRASTEPMNQKWRWFGLGRKKRTLDKETSGGWVQTGSGDEWDGDSGDESRPQSQHPPDTVGFPYPATPFIPVQHQSDSSSSIRFDMRQTPNYPSIQSRLSTPTGTPSAPLSPMRESPEPMEMYDSSSDQPDTPKNQRHASSTSVRTFTGGTKFVEQL